MNNKWSGGQYSIFRALLGSYLIVHFLHLLPWVSEIFSSAGMLSNGSLSPLMAVFPNLLLLNDSPATITVITLSAAIAAIFFTVGKYDKPAALWMWFVLACLLGRNPLISNPSLPYVGWMLLAHLFIPGKPYGSLAAVGQTDPKGNWFMPKHIFLAGWVILSLSYSYSAYTKLLSPSWVSGDNVQFVLQNPIARDWFLHDIFMAMPDGFLATITWIILLLELFFAPLALIRKLRPWIWTGMLVVQFGFLALLNFADLTIGMLLIHLFTFDPAWLKPKYPRENAIIYYDGYCGLCHRTVRWLLAEDQAGLFSFSPQTSSSFRQLQHQNKMLMQSDSIVVIDSNKCAHIKGNAVLYILFQLGGIWRVFGLLFNLFPKELRNLAYDFVGQRRLKWFGIPKNSCPVVPASYLERFTDT